MSVVERVCVCMCPCWEIGFWSWDSKRATSCCLLPMWNNGTKFIRPGVIHQRLSSLLFPANAHHFLSSSLFGVNISLTAIISTATAGGTRADNSPEACILRIRQAMTRLLEINLGELLFPWPPKLHFYYLLRNAGQTVTIVSFTQTSIHATVRVNMQWVLWLPLIILGFINHMLAGGYLASEKKNSS